MAAASTAAAKALTLSRQSGSVTPRFEAALADARVKAESGQKAAAIQELEAGLASAHKFGYGIYEYEMSLAIGEIELQSGLPSASARLAALEKEAETHGILLVARQAQELRANHGTVGVR